MCLLLYICDARYALCCLICSVLLDMVYVCVTYMCCLHDVLVIVWVAQYICCMCVLLNMLYVCMGYMCMLLDMLYVWVTCEA